jgi:hypothetical protein
MSTVTSSRTVVVVGRRPRGSAADVLGAVRPGEEAALFLLGLDPTPQQRRLADEALALAAEHRFELTEELIPAPPWLWERLRDGDDLRWIIRPGEARRWKIGPGRDLSAHDGR